MSPRTPQVLQRGLHTRHQEQRAADATSEQTVPECTIHFHGFLTNDSIIPIKIHSRSDACDDEDSEESLSSEERDLMETYHLMLSVLRLRDLAYCLAVSLSLFPSP